MSDILTWSPAAWSMYVRWQVGEVAPGLNPATNPKLAVPPDTSMKPPPVTKSFGIGLEAPHRMSLWACETMTSSPVTRVRCSAFTVMSDVPSCEPSICSLMTRVRTPGTETIWFGAVPTTTSWPAARRFTSSLRAETPRHVATDWDRTKSAVTSFGVPVRRSTVATADSLRATESNPIVSERRMSAFASDVSTWTKVASNSPPAEGGLPEHLKRSLLPHLLAGDRDSHTITALGRDRFLIEHVGSRPRP